VVVGSGIDVTGGKSVVEMGGGVKVTLPVPISLGPEVGGGNTVVVGGSCVVVMGGSVLIGGRSVIVTFWFPPVGGGVVVGGGGSSVVVLIGTGGSSVRGGGSVTLTVGTTVIVGRIVGIERLITGGVVVVGSAAGGAVGVTVGAVVALAGGATMLVSCETRSLTRVPIGSSGGATEEVTTPAVPAPKRIPPVVDVPDDVSVELASAELGFDVGRTTLSGFVPIVPTDTPSPIPRPEPVGVPVSNGSTALVLVSVVSGWVPDEVPSPKGSGKPGKKPGIDCLLEV